MCEIQLSCCHGGVECMCRLGCTWISRHVCLNNFQTIESEWDSYFFVGSTFFYLCAKCGNKHVTTLTLGLRPKQRHGKMWVKNATSESHSHFWECERMWGNESIHSQVGSHFRSWNLYEIMNIQRTIWGVKIH
jgi:hypothetical protein